MQHKQTATGLAALGRKGDTELVHMTKSEVQGLHALAKAKGGELTWNPETGLLEANFLKSMMPMVIGGALAMTGVGAPLAAGIVAGGYTMATGSLQKGLMAGLGAYGGAGIAGGLAGMGAAGAAEGAGALGAAGSAASTTAAGANMAGVQAAGTGAASLPGMGGASGLQAGMSGAGGLNAGMGAASGTGYGLGTQAGAALPSMGGVGGILPTTTVGAAAPAALGPTGVQVATPTWESIKAGAGNVTGSTEAFTKFLGENKMPLGAMGISALSGMEQEKLNAPEENPGMIRPYTFNRTQTNPEDALGAHYTPGQSTRERNWFEDSYTAGTPYKAPGPEYLAGGGPVEAMSNANAIGQNTQYPMANINAGAYSTPLQQPISQNIISGSQDTATNPYTGQETFADGGSVSGGVISGLLAQGQQGGQPQYQNGSVGGFDYNQATGAYSRSPQVQQQQQAQGGGGGLFGQALNSAGPLGDAFRQAAGQQGARPQYANGSVGGYEYGGNNQFTQQKAMANGGITALSGGGESDLGGYSDGGQLLRGPGDGVSDSIEAQIGNKQPARLADGEFVVPARIVSELGNGSTEAGSRQLYAMMDRVQNARKKSIGKDKVATNSRAAKHLPA